MNTPIWYRRARYNTRENWLRFKLGVRFGLGLTTPTEASEIRYRCHEITGCWPLQWIDAEGVIELAEDRWKATDRWGTPVDFEAYAKDAVRRVHTKWPGNDDMTGAAQDWAMDLIGEYALQDGIALLDNEEVFAL